MSLHTNSTYCSWLLSSKVYLNWLLLFNMYSFYLLMFCIMCVIVQLFYQRGCTQWKDRFKMQVAITFISRHQKLYLTCWWMKVSETLHSFTLRSMDYQAILKVTLRSTGRYFGFFLIPLAIPDTLFFHFLSFPLMK